MSAATDRHSAVMRKQFRWVVEAAYRILADALRHGSLRTSVFTCHTRRSIAVYLFKPEACSRKSCFTIFGRSARSVDRNRLISDGRGQIKDIVSIRQRPAAVEDRAVPGHWEGDLLSGSKNSYIATLVERHTRYVMLAKVANKDTQSVVSALIRQARKLPSELYKSLTWDRGKELSDHRRFTLATNLDVYFCDPQSPWQRGSNENTNGLLRQYFPKGTDLSVHSQAYLNKVARQLNERPRQTLQFETPAERFNACVASTG